VIYSLHFSDTRSENVHSFVAKLERGIHARLVCPSGEILATQFAEHVQIRKGHEQLAVPSVCLECNADHFMKIQMKIIGRVVVASNKIG
jgi:RNase P subunit RPR2